MEWFRDKLSPCQFFIAQILTFFGGGRHNTGIGMASDKTTFITTGELLDHWQGHRKLTRQVIEAFPENAFFTFNIGGMRPFSEMIIELIGITSEGLRGLLIDDWESLQVTSNWEWPAEKAGMLQLWDEVTSQLNSQWPKIPQSRFHETIVTFGEYRSSAHTAILYWVDNEIHHRGQAYVYLRALGVKPPGFWER